MVYLKELVGEAIGTFILVLFGCGSVAGAVLFNTFTSLLEVALIWGFGVTIAIFVTRNICPAHLNPAVSLAMVIMGKLSLRKLPSYILFQMIGAFLAALVLFLTLENAIITYELNNNIVRGSLDSVQTAMFFGEYFPNPGLMELISVSVYLAFSMEFLGTFLLVFVILKVTESSKQIDNITPLIIGLTVTVIICLAAPFTQAGLNPARDFAPRIVAYWAGWGNVAFPPIPFSFFTVYILAPMLAAVGAVYVHKLSLAKR
ncbi:MIP/aquaporin family protein [Maribacter sp. CXY002]|uniref:MIP/aquaporin family protein n=1 Tax=Maribacter luteocoastalis TaxID=3407671 RepID=UPI003B67525B